MGAKKNLKTAVDLDDRETQILRSIVRQHVLSGEPVGSKTVSRGARLDLSPATIRNVMAGLEERGLLTQPHTSAGRVPTARAYRLFVDHMIGKPRMQLAQGEAIDLALSASRGEITEMLEEASRQLSRLSNQVGVVIGPELQRIIVEHFEFVRLDDRRVVAILVGRSGLVHNRILEVEQPLEQSELDQIGRYLSEQFGGLTLWEIRNRVELLLREESAAYDRLVARGLDLGRRTLNADRESVDVFVDGASNLLGAPEFADAAKAKALFETLERKRTLIGLLSCVLEGDGVQVVIGEEHPDSGLGDCSLVAAHYGDGNQMMGTVGIVGPTRMEYARVIALVDHLAQVLGRLLSRAEN